MLVVPLDDDDDSAVGSDVIFLPIKVLFGMCF